MIFALRVAYGPFARSSQVWQWQNEDGTTKEYYDAESFRAAVEEEQLDSDLRALLPRPDGKPIEKPAEAALRQRMCAPRRPSSPPAILPYDNHCPRFNVAVYPLPALP